MLNLTTGTIRSYGTKLHYYRTGGDLPPLVLLHGISDDGLCWTPFAEAVCDRFDVIMVDLRGHGKSEAPEGGYTLEVLASEVAGLIRGLGLEKPVLLGHSLGAVTALALAGLFTQLPRGILLEDPPPFWGFDPASAPDKHGSRLVEWLHANKRKTWDDLLAEGRANPLWSEAELEPWINSKHRYSPRVAELVNPPDLASLDLPGLIQRITCPALLISADPKCGAASGKKDIAQLQGWLPQLQVEPIPGAGHNIRRDQFERYLAVVSRALDELI